MWRYFVDQVWPNLLANVLWDIPLAGAYVWHQRKHFAHIKQHVTDTVRDWIDDEG